MNADVWAIGDAYEPYVGRWSRLVAHDFLAWLGVRQGARWLDVGCGTGALTATILHDAAPAHVEAVDASDGFVAYARADVTDPRATFVVADARTLPQPSASIDAAVSALALNFIPQPERAVAEMARVTRDDGIIAAYVWDYADGMQLIRRFWDAAIAIDPSAATLDEAARFAMCDPRLLEALWHTASLGTVTSHAIDVPMHFTDFDDLWQPFLGGQGPAPTYVLSLGAEHRERLRDRFRAMLPVADDGSIELVARAWAVKGRVYRR